MYDLSNHKLISFEVTDDCNLKEIHPECPIHHQEYNRLYGSLNEEKINQSIKEASQLNFKGHFEFHHYNEPLLDKELILRIVRSHPQQKFALITNALLLSRNVDENEFLSLFSLVVISCYYPELSGFYQSLKNKYANIIFSETGLDDRLAFYTKLRKKKLCCLRQTFL